MNPFVKNKRTGSYILYLTFYRKVPSKFEILWTGMYFSFNFAWLVFRPTSQNMIVLGGGGVYLTNVTRVIVFVNNPCKSLHPSSWSTLKCMQRKRFSEVLWQNWINMHQVFTYKLHLTVSLGPTHTRRVPWDFHSKPPPNTLNGVFPTF